MRDYAKAILFAGLLISMYAGPVFANGNHERNNHERPNQHSDASSTSRAGAAALAGAAAGAQAAGHAVAGGGSSDAFGEGGTGYGGSGGDGGAGGAGGAGGEATSSNDGNTYSSSNRSANFYVSRSLPASMNSCALSADGGGGDNGTAGFLGFQWLDHGCVMDKLAEMEDNADLKALLKCGNKRFRNAVAYDQKGKERQAYCHGYVKEIYLAEIAEIRGQMMSEREFELEMKRAGVNTKKP